MNDTYAQLLNAVRDYRTPPSAIKLLTANPPMLLVGITASGKDAVQEHIQKISSWRHVVTHTTRALRPGETNGKDYWFVSEAEMQHLVATKALIEVELIHERQISGSSIEAYNSVLNDGYRPIMHVDVKGVKGLRIQVPGIRPFFILPPSFEVWMERLDKRGHMSHIERVHRMQSARNELETAINDEHYILVVNNEIPLVAQEIVGGVTDISSQLRNRELARQLIDHIKAY